MINSHALFVIWIAFTILVICAVIPFAVWAVRSGHFSKFDYAGRLPLKSQIIEDKKEQNEDVSA
jgi:hypothetical protein